MSQFSASNQLSQLQDWVCPGGTVDQRGVCSAVGLKGSASGGEVSSTTVTVPWVLDGKDGDWSSSYSVHYTLVWSLRREANAPTLALFKWDCVCSNGVGFQDKLVKKYALASGTLYKDTNPAHHSRHSQKTISVSSAGKMTLLYDVYENWRELINLTLFGMLEYPQIHLAR